MQKTAIKSFEYKDWKRAFDRKGVLKMQILRI